MEPFYEKQKFPWWVLLLPIGLFFLFAYSVYQQLVLGIPFGDNPMSNSGLLFSSLIPIGLLALFFIIRLETRISEQGIEYRFYPIHSKYKLIKWDELANAYTRTYNPILEYGGWGFKLGIMGKGRALNISGNKGLQLILKNGNKILIGTKKSEEIAALLRSFTKLNPALGS